MPRDTNPQLDREVSCATWIILMVTAAMILLATAFSYKHKACMLQHPGVPSWTCWINP